MPLLSRIAALGLGIAVAWVHLPVASAQDADPGLVDLILELVADPDREIRSLALEQIRNEAPGEDATRRLADHLPHLAPESRADLLAALAARGDAAAKPTIVRLLATEQDPAVRLAAIRAIGALGDHHETPLLLDLLEQSATEERQAVRAALIRLRGSEASDAIAIAMEKASPEIRVPLIDVLVERRATEALPRVLAAALDEEADIRAAAMVALAKLAEPQHLPGMIDAVLRAEPGSERAAAEKAVMLVCQRHADTPRAIESLLAAIDAHQEPAEQRALLSTLGRVGGPAALARIEQALASDDPAVQEAGLRGLTNWPDATAAPQLIKVVAQSPEPSRQIAALRALIRIAPLPDGRTDVEKLALLRQAMELCTRDEERLLALQRAAAIRLPETLEFVVTYLDQPKFAPQACDTIVELAHHRGLREPHKELFTAALERVLATSRDPVVVDRAQRYLANQTWVRPKHD